MVQNLVNNSDNLLLHPLLLNAASFTMSQVINFVLFLFSILTLFFIGRNNKKIFISPACIISVLFIVFYQVPLVIYTPIFEKSLTNYGLFALSIHAIVILGPIWFLLTSKLAFLTVNGKYNLKEIFLKNDNKETLFLVFALCLFLIFGLTSIYLLHVPIQCTGIYATLFNPNLSGLARELSIKLSNSSLATYSYGALVNTVIPTFVAILVFQLKKIIKKKLLFSFLIISFMFLLLFLIVLLPGIKGMLMPTFMVMLFMVVLVSNTLLGKVFNTVLCIGIFFTLLTSFETFRERHSYINDLPKYNAGLCAFQLNSCSQTDLLIKSLFLRANSLGLTEFDKKFVESQINCFCFKKCSTFNGYVKYISSLNMLYPDIRIYSDTKGHPIVLGTLEHAEKFFKAILYRTFVVPIQAASWHYLYVTQYHNPGIYVLPFAKRIFEYSFNAPSEVYQAYGSIYSEGDKTSTSTAPTSYLLFYPAYLGIYGLLLGFLCLAVFDLIARFILMRLQGLFAYIYMSLLFIVCTNMLVSDFITVLLSHGAGATLLLFAVISFLSQKKISFKHFFDSVIAGSILILSFPLSVLIAFLIRINLGASIFFIQERPGLNGKLFKMIKFRTMLNQTDKSGNFLPDERRITRFGKFLRKTSLDELPELWNVLKGDMSLVGPRPLLKEYLPLYTPEQMRRHEVKPGITGWAQINGRNAISWEEKFKLDIWYIDNQSFLLDLKIIFLTMLKIFSGSDINQPGHATAEKFTGTK